MTTTDEQIERVDFMVRRSEMEEGLFEFMFILQRKKRDYIHLKIIQWIRVQKKHFKQKCTI